MSTEYSKYDALIMDYLDGICSTEEAQTLLSWLADSESNRAHFEEFKQVWTLTDFDFPTDIDTEAALAKVNETIDEMTCRKDSPVVAMPWLKRNLKATASAAAAVVVAMILGFQFLKPHTNIVTLASSEWNNETPYLLPDGSSITFEGESTVSYAADFEQRNIDFEGKAHFDIAKDANRTFTIHCGNINVEVLGTDFMLNTDQDNYIVDLFSGKVKMANLDKKGREIESIELAPGQRGVFNSTNGNLKTMSYREVKQEELTTEHVLDFNDVKLSTIVETLEFLYDIEIELPEKYANGKLTARFTDQDSVDEMLETIATVFNFEFTKNGNTYTIL